VVVGLQPIMNRESIEKVKGYDEKLFAVNEAKLSGREPLLMMTCGKGLQLNNYRCCE